MKFFVWTRKEKDMRTFEGYQKGMMAGFYAKGLPYGVSDDGGRV